MMPSELIWNDLCLCFWVQDLASSSRTNNLLLCGLMKIWNQSVVFKMYCLRTCDSKVEWILIWRCCVDDCKSRVLIHIHEMLWFFSVKIVLLMLCIMEEECLLTGRWKAIRSRSSSCFGESKENGSSPVENSASHCRRSSKISKADLWLIFFSLMLGSGSGLTVIDNLGQMSDSLGYDNTHVFVSMISIFNFLGRIGGGYISWHPWPCRSFVWLLSSWAWFLSIEQSLYTVTSMVVLRGKVN